MCARIMQMGLANRAYERAFFVSHIGKQLNIAVGAR